ncbi:hypothetical protein LINPERHAP1_LOCUS6082 [Linum perenne]
MWKFGKKTPTPRLSLYSRATVDGKGRLKPRELQTSASMPTKSGGEESESNKKDHNRSPSVITKLMELEWLPESDPEEAGKQPQLRISRSDQNPTPVIGHWFLDGIIPPIRFQYPFPSKSLINSKPLLQGVFHSTEEKIDHLKSKSSSELTLTSVTISSFQSILTHIWRAVIRN